MKKKFWVHLTFLLGLFLTLLPWSHYWAWFRPQWILLILLYWVFYSKQPIHLMMSWSIGLFLDLLTGALFGQQALLMVLLHYLSAYFGNRLKLYNRLEQLLIILAVLVLSQLPLYVLTRLLKQSGSFYYEISLFSSLCLWPIVYSALKYYEKALVR